MKKKIKRAPLTVSFKAAGTRTRTKAAGGSKKRTSSRTSSSNDPIPW